MKFLEHYKRSFTKAITFRIGTLVINYLVIARITGQQELAAGLVFTTSILSTIIYFLHERIWNRIDWGKHHHKKN